MHIVGGSPSAVTMPGQGHPRVYESADRRFFDSAMRKLFPDTALVYRTTTRLNEIRDSDDNEMVSIFQQNENARALMKELKIPILNCKAAVERVIVEAT